MNEVQRAILQEVAEGRLSPKAAAVLLDQAEKAEQEPGTEHDEPSEETGDETEWLIMRMHPEMGVQMVSGIKSLGPAVEVIRSHHERWDGRGYPSGLVGEEIPLSARIFSVCDAFDAMTSDRPYRRALPFEQAVDQIMAGTGTQFDPAMAEAVVSIANLEALHASLHTRFSPHPPRERILAR